MISLWAVWWPKFIAIWPQSQKTFTGGGPVLVGAHNVRLDTYRYAPDAGSPGR